MVYSDRKLLERKKNYLSILQDAQRVSNGNETCFMLHPKEEKVLAFRRCKNVYQVDQGAAKANLTVMFAFWWWNNASDEYLFI